MVKMFHFVYFLLSFSYMSTFQAKSFFLNRLYSDYYIYWWDTIRNIYFVVFFLQFLSNRGDKNIFWYS